MSHTTEADFPPNPQGSLHEKGTKNLLCEGCGIRKHRSGAVSQILGSPLRHPNGFFSAPLLWGVFVDRNMAVPPDCPEQRIVCGRMFQVWGSLNFGCLKFTTHLETYQISRCILNTTFESNLPTLYVQYVRL